MRVATSESRWLHFVQAVARGAGGPSLRLQLLATYPLADQVGPTCAGLFTRMLAREAVRTLAREGGWRDESRPVDDPEVVHDGRLWDRRPVPALAFGPWTLAVLRWAYTSPVHGEPPPVPDEMLLGDRLVAFWLARVFLATGLHDGLRAVEHEPLAVLLAAGRRPFTGDWPVWLEEGDVLLEGLVDALGRAWAAAEREKLALTDPAALTVWSAHQHAILAPLLDAVVARGRPDLADFLLVAGEALVPEPDAAPTLEQAPLDRTASLRDRTAALEASPVLATHIGRLEHALQRARVTRFFEDGYDAAQARLRRWERFGDARARVFRQVR